LPEVKRRGDELSDLIDFRRFTDPETPRAAASTGLNDFMRLGDTEAGGC
jgi:hypothetical protein